MEAQQSEEARLVEENMGLVWGVIGRARADLRGDRFQVGSIGLLKAIRSHDPAKGALSSLAIPCIRNEVNAARSNEGLIGLHYYFRAIIAIAEDARREASVLFGSQGDEFAIGILCNKFGMSYEEAAAILKNRPVTFTPDERFDMEGDRHYILEKINVDSRKEDEEVMKIALMKGIAIAFELLREHERQAIIDHYFKEKTYKEIADAMGITEIGVKKKIQRALEKIREAFKKRGYKFEDFF